MRPALQTRDSQSMRVVQGGRKGNPLFGIPAGAGNPYLSAVVGRFPTFGSQQTWYNVTVVESVT